MSPSTEEARDDCVVTSVLRLVTFALSWSRYFTRVELVGFLLYVIIEFRRRLVRSRIFETAALLVSIRMRASDSIAHLWT